jgi:hypothetical protein
MHAALVVSTEQSGGEVQFNSGWRAAELLHRTAVREKAEVERDQARRIYKFDHDRLGIAIVS